MKTFCATVPDDWNGQNYCVFLICVPDSAKWKQTVKACINQLTRNNYWRDDGGSIKNAQAVAWNIYDSICMSCNSLDEISDSIKLNNQLMKHLIATLSDGSVYDDDYYLSNKSSFSSVFYINQLDLGTGIRDWSIADLFSESFFASYTRLSQALNSEINFGWLGLGDILKRAETALRHIDAKLSRDGVVRNVLADGVPFSQNPFIPPSVGNLLTPFMTAYTSPSVFTYDRAMNYYPEWITSSIVESLRAGVRPGINLGTPLNPSYVLGSYGTAIADLFKAKEDDILTINVPLLGTLSWEESSTGFIIKLNGVRVFPPGTVLIEAGKPKGKSFYDMMYEKVFNATLDTTALEDAINNKQLDFDCNFGDVNVDLTDVVNAIDSLDNALKRDSETIARAIALLEAALEKTSNTIEALKVVAIANTGNNANINLCCEKEAVQDLPEPNQIPDSSVPIPDDNSIDPTEPGWDPYNPVTPVVAKPTPFRWDESKATYHIQFTEEQWASFPDGAKQFYRIYFMQRVPGWVVISHEFVQVELDSSVIPFFPDNKILPGVLESDGVTIQSVLIQDGYYIKITQLCSYCNKLEVSTDTEQEYQVKFGACNYTMQKKDVIAKVFYLENIDNINHVVSEIQIKGLRPFKVSLIGLNNGYAVDPNIPALDNRLRL